MTWRLHTVGVPVDRACGCNAPTFGCKLSNSATVTGHMLPNVGKNRPLLLVQILRGVRARVVVQWSSSMGLYWYGLVFVLRW